MLLSLESRELLVECPIQQPPRSKKLLAHEGAMCVEDACRLGRHAAKAGAHAVSSLPPPGPFSEVRSYYVRLAQDSQLPPILYYFYYFPEVCPDAFRKAAELEAICVLPNVSAVEFTDYNLFLMKRLTAHRTLVNNGRDEVMAAGLLMGAGDGIGSTFNGAPRLYVELCQSALRREWEQSRKLQETVYCLVSALWKCPLLPAIKSALRHVGIECGAALNGRRFDNEAEMHRFLAELARVLPEFS